MPTASMVCHKFCSLPFFLLSGYLHHQKAAFAQKDIWTYSFHSYVQPAQKCMYKLTTKSVHLVFLKLKLYSSHQHT